MEYAICKVCGEPIDIIDSYKDEKIYYCEECGSKYTKRE